MMRGFIRAISLGIIIALWCGSGYAEDHYLIVVAVNLQNNPIAGVELAAEGGLLPDTTNSKGIARILLRYDIRPDKEVSLRITKPDNLVFISPYNGVVRVPPFDNEQKNNAKVQIVERGVKELLRNRNAIFAILYLIRDKSLPGTSLEIRQRSLSIVADIFGLDPLEMHRAIIRVKTKAPSERAELEFYKRNYEKAEEYFTKARDEVRTEKNRLRQTVKELDQREAIYTLNIGLTRYNRGLYREAISEYREAKEVLPEDTEALSSKISKNLAAAFYQVGEYAESEALYTALLKSAKNRSTPNTSEVAQMRNNLIEVYRVTGQYAKAEELCNESLNDKDFVLRHNDSIMGETLNNKASLYLIQRRYTEAEPLLTRALDMLRKSPEPNYLALAARLSNLASLYRIQNRKEEAEPLYKLALSITTMELVAGHPILEEVKNQEALIYLSNKDYKKAEQLFKESLDVFRKRLGPEHIKVALVLNNLAETYHRLNQMVVAEDYYRQALKILEKVLGRKHPNVAAVRSNLATLHLDQGRYGDAEEGYKEAIDVYEKTFGEDSPIMVTTLTHYASLLRKTDRTKEAEKMEERAKINWNKYNPGRT